MSDLQKLVIGSTRIVALRDGELSLPKEILLNVDDDTSTKISDENNKLTLNNVNAYLIFKDDKTLLVDAGCRDLFGPSCGFVHDEIAKANVKPEDITDIFFTHLHPDHVAGAIDKDGKAMFPNAVVKVLEEELNFWSKDDFEDVEINGKNFADLNKLVIKAYKDKVQTLKPNQEIISGVFPVSLPGHTPGHSGFRIDDQNKSFVQSSMPWKDLIYKFLKLHFQNFPNDFLHCIFKHFYIRFGVEFQQEDVENLDYQNL